MHVESTHQMRAQISHIIAISVKILLWICKTIDMSQKSYYKHCARADLLDMLLNSQNCWTRVSKEQGHE